MYAFADADHTQLTQVLGYGMMCTTHKYQNIGTDIVKVQHSI